MLKNITYSTTLCLWDHLQTCWQADICDSWWNILERVNNFIFFSSTACVLDFIAVDSLLFSNSPLPVRPGRVKEHAKKLNKMVSESELRPPMPGTQAPLTPTGNNTLLVSTQPGNKEEADAMLGLSEQLKRRWMVKSSCCDYNEMLQMLRECPRLAGFKDCTSVIMTIRSHWDSDRVWFMD